MVIKLLLYNTMNSYVKKLSQQQTNWTVVINYCVEKLSLYYKTNILNLDLNLRSDICSNADLMQQFVEKKYLQISKCTFIICILENIFIVERFLFRHQNCGKFDPGRPFRSVILMNGFRNRSTRDTPG